MSDSAARYIAWRSAVGRNPGWIVETEYPQPMWPSDFIVTTDGDLARETLHVEALRDYRPNYVNWFTELSDGSWVLHREDGPAQILAQTENVGSWEDGYTSVIGAGACTWWLYGKLVDSFNQVEAPLILLGLTEL